MKKILSMGIASAVLALTAVAASAEINATTDGNAVTGDTITVAITTTEEVKAIGFTVSATGLEATSANVEVTGQAIAGDADDGSIIISGADLKGWAAGATIATITYTVTAETGADVSVALAAHNGMEHTFGDALKLTVVEGTEQPGGDPVDPGTEPGGDPVDPGTEPGGEQPGGETPPETGVALAVVPAVLAGAAVVVAKKRK